jgi:hypothetical protein
MMDTWLSQEHSAAARRRDDAVGLHDRYRDLGIAVTSVVR